MRSPNPHRAFAFLLPVALAVPLLPACSSKSGGTTMGNVIITDANNYSSVSSLTIPVVPVAPLSDLTFTWDGLTKDLLCHPAGTVDNVAFLQIKNQTQMQVEQKMAVGLIGQKQVAVYGEQHTKTGTANAVTTAQTTMFDWYDKFTPTTDFAVSSTTQYVMLFTHGTALGAGAMSMVFIQPTDGVATTAVSAPNPCPDGVANGANNVLNFVATLSPMAVSIPINGPWKIDWSEITTDNFGNPLNFSTTQLDKVEVGFFQGKTPADIQGDFVNVEQDATALYTYQVPQGQNYIDIMNTTPTSGGAFPGFAGMTDGTWAVAVISTADSVPAPLIFAVLQPQ
jgi:hypothetical protein